MIPDLIGFDVALVLALVAIAMGTLLSHDLFQSVVLFIVFGLLMAVAWCRLEAVDVALAEAAIGAGLTGALLLNTLAATRGGDALADGPERADRFNGGTPDARLTSDSQRLNWIAISIATACLAAVLAAVTLPLAHAPPSSASTAIVPLPPSGVSHPVTAVLLNFRAYDTLLEVAVLLAAVWALLPVPSGTGRLTDTEPLEPALATFIRLIVPLAVMTGMYVLWVGTKAPGGAFQAAAILTAVAVLLILGGAAPPTTVRRRWRVLLVAGLLGFLLIAVEGLLAGRRFLEYRPDWEGVAILVVEIGLTFSIASILTTLFSCTSPHSDETTTPREESVP